MMTDPYFETGPHMRIPHSIRVSKWQSLAIAFFSTVLYFGIYFIREHLPKHAQPQPNRLCLYLQFSVFAHKSNTEYRLRFLSDGAPRSMRSNGRVYESSGRLELLDLRNRVLDRAYVSCAFDTEHDNGSLTDRGDLESAPTQETDIGRFMNSFRQGWIRLFNFRYNSDGYIESGQWRSQDNHYLGTFKADYTM